MHPPLPIPSPPVFEVSSQSKAGKAESSQPQQEEEAAWVLHAVESCNSRTQAETAAAAQRALPDDDDFEEDEQVWWPICMLYTATVQTKYRTHENHSSSSPVKRIVTMSNPCLRCSLQVITLMSEYVLRYLSPSIVVCCDQLLLSSSSTLLKCHPRLQLH